MVNISGLDSGFYGSYRLGGFLIRQGRTGTGYVSEAVMYRKYMKLQSGHRGGSQQYIAIMEFMQYRSY